MPKNVLESLLQEVDLSRQALLFEKLFGSERFQQGFKHYTSTELISSQGRDPVQFTYVEVEPSELLWSRFKDVCTKVPARDNFYLRYLFTGSYADDHLPPQFRESVFSQLKQCISSLEVRQERVDQTLEHYGRGHFSKCNFSDLFEYLSIAEAGSLFDLCKRQMALGGRIAYWNLLVDRAPESLGDRRWARVPESEKLSQRDRCFFYACFRVEELQEC